MKKCTKCGQEKIEDCFHKDKRQNSGLRPDCKDCVLIRSKNYYKNNAELIRKKDFIRDKDPERKRKKSNANKKRYEKNKEKILSYQKKYYEQNKELINKKSSEYYNKNKEYFAAKRKEYYKNNKDKIISRSVEWGKKNKEKRKEYTSKWIQNNPEYHSIRNGKRRSKLKNNSFNIYIKEIKKIYNSPCFFCGTKDKIEVDHIVPISKGGRHSIGNLQPLCRKHNREKGDMLWVEFITRNRSKDL